ncbi:MAG: 3'(2'),5'-bisphosphate nucleotidase CysQ [Deltaproteobacteria bacterium]|nr:3'(2'),5'-bisphosphate nucleotidase CysQ [Deltaproteobacteria bacterium]
MKQSEIDLSIELKLAELLARQAGEATLKLQHLGVARYKDNHEGPVTEGDLKAEKIIIGGIHEAFPEDLIISEESFISGTEVPKAHRIWFIDPIDGTKSYVSGGEDYAIMIGLAIDGRPKLGVIFAPATQTLWRAQNDNAERIEPNGKIVKLNVRDKKLGPNGFRLAVSHHASSPFTHFLNDNLPVAKVIRKSSVGIKTVLVADGQADAYLSSGRNIKLWDTCGPAAILIGAGGIFSSLQSQELQFSGNIQHGIEIMAATPHAASLLQKKIPEVIKQWNLLKRTKTP